MKILVINGSPKGERSDTLKLTRAFLEGMGENAEIIDTMKINVKPCTGCYSCWFSTPGKCVQKDDEEDLLCKIVSADLVIWSLPLYCYSFPSNCKVVIDRLLPLSCPTFYTDKEGKTHHHGRGSVHAKMLLISGCGFPERKGNYDGLIFQFGRLFGADSPMILCTEAPMLSVPAAGQVIGPYFAAVRKAGSEFAETGKISEETQKTLDTPMLPPDVYLSFANK